MGNSTTKEVTFPTKDIVSDGVEDISEHRIDFEKKIKFLMISEKLSCHGALGSQGKKDVIPEITRGNVKAYLENFNINENKDWINEHMPGKLISKIKNDNISSYFILTDKKKEMEEHIDYKNVLIDIKLETYKEICHDFNETNIEEFYKKIISICYSQDKQNISIDKRDIINLLTTHIISEEDKNYFIQNFKNKLNDKKDIYNEVNNLSFEDFMIKIKDFINSDDINKFFGPLCIMSFNKMNPETKKLLVCDFILNYDSFHNVINNIYFGIILIGNESFGKKEKKIQQKYFKECVYDTLPEEEKSKYTVLSIDFDSHYEFYKLDEKEYMQVLYFNALCDDWTFPYYPYSDFTFLDGFNTETKNSIISKINADTTMNSKASVQEKYGEITTLDNFIDISIFTEDPPDFLKYNQCKYIPEHIEIMLNYLKDFNYDEKKLNYKKYKINISFTIEN